MMEAEDTEQTTQRSTHARTETHWLPWYLVAVMRARYSTLALTQRFPATLPIMTRSTEWAVRLEQDMKGTVQKLNTQLGGKLTIVR